MKGEDNSVGHCRLCGNAGGDLVNVFDDKSSKLKLVEVINDTLHLTVNESDLLPKTVCKKCVKIVEEFERFRQSCISAAKSFAASVKGVSNPQSTECSLENQSYPSDEKFEATALEIMPDVYLENIKIEAVDENEQFSGDDNGYDEAVIKEPHKDDYILVKQDKFTIDESARRVQNNFVEYCKPGIMPSDRILVQNVQKRQALPEMWDVYEMESKHNMTEVTMRRYIISKEAFPCSLCNKCISVKSDKDPQEEENWEINAEYQGHVAGINEEVFKKSNSFTEPRRGKAKKSSPVVPSCSICKKSFLCKKSLKRHYRTHFGYERLPCEVCGKGFSRKEHLARHMILHSGGRPFKCTKCKQDFTRKEHLTRHIQLHQSRDCSFKNVRNSESFEGYPKSTKKKRKGHECRPKPYSCDICGAGFGQKEHLVKHTRRMHSDCSPPSRIPSIVNKSISNDISKEDKMETASVPAPTLPQKLPSTSSEKNIYLCELCPRSFSRTEHLGRHLKVHRRDSMFVNESRVPGTDITCSFTNSKE